MKHRTSLIWLLAAFLLWNTGCQQSNPTEPVTAQTTTVSGQVLDSLNQPIDIARVEDIGAKPTSDSSKADGSYQLTWQLTENYNTSLVVTRRGYFSDTLVVSLKAGDNLTGQNFQLRVKDSVYAIRGVSGPPISIVLRKQSTPTIALRGTGNNESCTLTFVVKDSSGNPVVGLNQCMVTFRISGGPNAGEFLLPASAKTDPVTGEVSTSVTSGTAPGVLQVIASTRGDTVKASPVFLAAGGGLPDSAGVSIGATKLNIAGRLYGNLRTTITLSVGDRFGNPVAAGTMVSFQTDPVARLSVFAATTDREGNASVDLISTTNKPPTGLVRVTASTTGDKFYRASDSTIVRSMPILFSGPTQPPTLGASASNFTIADGTTNTFDFYVSDDLGNPLVGGSKVEVSVKAADTLMPDLDLLNALQVVKDSYSTSATHFTVSVRDKGMVKLSGYLTFGINITSENGNYSNENWFTGYVVGSSAVGNFGVPDRIDLADSTIRSLYLAETGITRETTKKLTFVVKDAMGNAMTASNRSLVTFSLLQSPTGTTLDKTQDSTDSRGQVAVSISAGNMYGTAQVMAQTMGATSLIAGFSQPIQVARGLPDSNRILVTLNKKNMFNNFGYQSGTINLTMLDMFGFPAAPQSSITASTTGGLTGLVPTTVDGKTSISLYGGMPEPPAGWGSIRVNVPVHGGGTSSKSLPFLFSYTPLIVFSNPSVVDTATFALRNSLNDGSYVDIDYIVWDKNRNPISSANSIKVDVSNASAQFITVSGDVNVASLSDTQDTTSVRYQFRIKGTLPSGSSETPFSVTITVTGESGTTKKTLTGNLLPVVSGYTSSIQMLTAVPTTFSVKETGETETAVITFQAKDSLGNPISASRADSMHFSFAGGGIGGGEFLNPPVVKTDAFGKAMTTVNAGTVSGVLQVVASIGSIKSAPVQLVIQSGLADPEHVTAGFLEQPSNYIFYAPPNFQQLSYDTTLIAMGSPIASIGVILGDKYSNPARPSAVYFTSNGNLITPSAISGVSGKTAAISIIRAIPDPPGGKDTITITTKGQGGQDITRKIFLTAIGSSVPAETGGSAATIKLVSSSSSTVSVKGTGASESALLKFVVNDSTGKAIDINHQVTVTFAITNGPGGGANLNPTTALTDASGQVSTTLNAGTISGPIAITASIASPAASASVNLTIAGGLPDQNHFTVWTDKVNYPGLLPQGGAVGVIRVQAGDIYGNPVQPSAIYLSSTGGTIDATITTNTSGAGQASIYGGNPNPPGGRNTITVTTAGGTVNKQSVVIFSGAPRITVSAFPKDSLSPLADGGFLLFGFDLKDVNNNPIASANTLTATVSGDQSLTSQLNVSVNGSGASIQLNDTQDTSSVHYQIKITDVAAGSGSGGYFALTLTSSGINGTVSKSLIGFLQAPGVVVGSGGGTGYTSSITLKSVSSTDISVVGTGSSETATLVFQAMDSLGQSVDAAHASMMHFSISAPTLGSVLTIDSITTDASGRATTLVRSGTISGVIQVKATVNVNGRTITSLPVRISINSGLPDQAHFTIGPQRFNFPGLDYNGLTNTITVQMGDQYSNPVQTGTVAYFNSTHGIIQTTGSTTSPNGFISKDLYSANPRPEFEDTLSSGPGWTYVYSTTAGPNGTTVKDSIRILWTGTPRITYTPAAFVIANGGGAGPYLFTVDDRYGHPLSAGTTILLSGSGLAITSNTPSSGLPDTQTGGSGITSFSVTIADADPATTAPAPISTQLILSVTHPVYGTFTRVLASGTYQ